MHYLKFIFNLKKTKKMTYSSENQALKIGFPTFVSKGEVTFYRSSDTNQNFSVPFNSISLFNYSTENLLKGKWKIQVTWSDGALEYFLEDEFTNN